MFLPLHQLATNNNPSGQPLNWGAQDRYCDLIMRPRIQGLSNILKLVKDSTTSICESAQSGDDGSVFNLGLNTSIVRSESNAGRWLSCIFPAALSQVAGWQG